MRRLLLVLLVACGGDDGPSTPAECNPLGSTGCVLPWPSSVYQRADGHLDLPLGALPINFDGIEIDPARINERTGFSPMSQILLTFPGSIDPTTLVGFEAIGDSLDGSTVILDMSTGERVAHWAEVDVNEIDKPEEQVLYLRPAVRLKGSTRYAVAIRKSVKAAAGGDLPIPDGFRAMLDKSSSGHKRLDAVRARFPEIFAALAGAGVPQSDLVVAFDFVTADDAALIADPLAARDAAMAVVGDGSNVTYTIKTDTPNPEAGIARIVRLEYVTPQIADLTGGTGFHRDGSGKVIVQGTTTTTASIVIPSCATAGNKAGLVIYGHGFFGGLDESTGSYIRTFAKATCNIVVGGLWRGMSADDVADAVLALNELNKMHGFGERIWQGMVDFMTLVKLAKGKLATEQLANIVDTSRIFYYGISQGHILGSTLFAYDPTLTRAVLGVGGANWAVMFERSKNWAAYSLPLKGAYGGVMNSVILQQVIEMGLELVDGGTIAPQIRAGGLPGTPPKQYLMQMSMGDCSVPNLASEYQARTLGFPLLGPSAKTPYGFTPMTGPLTGSGYVIMNESPSPLPPANNETFQYDNVAHENLRRRQAAIDQIVKFTTTGSIENFCTGACDCAAGACGPLN